VITGADPSKVEHLRYVLTITTSQPSTAQHAKGNAMICINCGLPALPGTTCINCDTPQPVITQQSELLAPQEATPEAGYWQAADGNLYAPEQHPDYTPPTTSTTPRKWTSTQHFYTGPDITLAWIFAIVFWPAGIVLSLINRARGGKFKAPLITSCVIGALSIVIMVTIVAPTIRTINVDTQQAQTAATTLDQNALTLSGYANQPNSDTAPSAQSLPSNVTQANGVAAITYVDVAAGQLHGVQVYQLSTTEYNVTKGLVTVCLTTSSLPGTTGTVTSGSCTGP
jgi:hypothetical protein